MPQRALTIDDIAREFGRTRAWAYENWRRLVADGRLPAPLHGDGEGLAWSAAQVYALLDKKLTKPQRTAAAAYRAAFEAAAASDATLIDTSEADARARLQQRYVKDQAA
jgi:transposase-like protein